MSNLSDRKWGEFFIGGENGVFEISSSSSGIDKNKLELNETNDVVFTPYVTRTDVSNGIKQFILEKQKECYELDAGNVITIGLDTQTVFFQTHKFYTGQNIQVLRHEKLNKYSAQFLIPLLKVQMEKFNWGGNGATLGRLFRTKIMLPIDKKRTPDWLFMEQYAKTVFEKKKQEYIEYSKKNLKVIEFKEIESLDKKEWDEFFIEDIAIIKSGTRLTKADMTDGVKPFIGSTDSNNGITEYVSNTNDSEDSNVLGVNYNGSVVENFYHSYKAIFSDDVKRLSFKDVKGNKYLYLFLKNSILKQKSKYQYAYKFNGRRLKRQKIMLPVSDDGKPDYKYMEQYIKNLEYKKRKQYLDFKFPSMIKS